MSDLSGREVIYTYASDLLSEVVDVLGNTSRYLYDAQGRIIESVDPAGRSTFVSYDDYGNAVEVVDKDGNGHFFDYDYDPSRKEMYARTTTSSGMIKEVWFNQAGENKRVDLNGRTVEQLIEGTRSLEIIDEKGNVTHKEFDEWDNVVLVRYPDGSTINREYEHNFHRPVRITNRRSVVTEFEYDADGNLMQKTEAAGTDSERVRTYTYDDFGQVLTSTVVGDVNTEEATTSYAYDATGNISSTTDPEGYRTDFIEYDVMGNPLEIRDALGNTAVFAYDEMGRVVSKTDPLGNEYRYEYDGANNRISSTDPDLNRFQFEYDDHNNLIRTIDPYGNEKTVEYNTDNLPLRTVDEEGKQNFRSYDSEWRLQTETDGVGNLTRYHYDETAETHVSSKKPVQIDYPTYTKRLYYDVMQRLIRTTDVLDENTEQSVSYTYDVAGNRTSQTDQEGRVTQYGYDALNRRAETVDALGGTTTVAFDDRDNVIAVTDANGGVTRFEYDRNNRQTKEIRPLGQETSFAYDAVGNLVQVVDAKGQVTEHVYDAAGRKTTTRYYASDDLSNPVKTVSYTYNHLGKLVGYDDGQSTGSYEYDARQQRTRETIDYGAFALTHSYGYYKNGTKRSITYPNGTTLEYTYDAAERIVSVLDAASGQITFGDYYWKKPRLISFPGNTVRELVYDQNMRQREATVRDPGGRTLLHLSYERSAVGNVTQKGTTYGDFGYEYDSLDRLISEQSPSGNVLQYGYDLLGNRMSDDSGLGELQYNSNNELLGNGSLVVEHDAAGNVTRKASDAGEFVFAYDVAHRLVSVESVDGPVTTEYAYDPFGRRLFKESNGNRVYYGYSEEGLAGEYDATGNEIRAYGYLPGGYWTTDPVILWANGRVHFYQNDYNGTPLMLVDGTGAVKWRATYQGFGQAQLDSDAVANPLRLPGQYYDEETGLHYNWHRYYDPELGRYLRVDPARDGQNAYVYVDNNPLAYIDPMGLCKIRDSWVGDFWRDVAEVRVPFLDAYSRLRSSEPRRALTPQDTVALNALLNVHPISGRSNTEYGGYICQDSSGRFVMGNNIVKGQERGVKLDGVASCPPSTKPTAYYHTHGAYNFGEAPEMFSKEDKIAAHALGIDAYLLSPAGRYMIYDEALEESIPLGRVR